MLFMFNEKRMVNWNEEARIRGALRQLARYMPVKKECLAESIHPTEKGPRGGALRVCAHCGLCFPMHKVHVDHIEPVIPVDREIKDWNEYIVRLFCDIDNLQVLCKECHLIKSNNENNDRN